jgi:hypothetical protein
MTFTRIAPLGPRKGPGTFDCFFDDVKYATMQQAHEANDFVIVDFVEDPVGVRYFEFYHSQTPEVRKQVRLRIQHFPFGIDMLDDLMAEAIAGTFFLNQCL